MTDVMINSLPQPTWHRLRVNNTTVTLPERLREASVTWTIPESTGAALVKGALRPEGSGLGADLSSLCAGSVLGLSFPAGSRSEDAVLMKADLTDAACSLHITAGAGCDQRVVLVLTGSGTSLLRLSATVAPEAKLHVSVAQLTAGGTCLQDLYAVVEDRAALNVTQLELGGSKIAVGNRIELAGVRADYQADMGYRLRHQKLDVNLLAHHTGAHTTSRMDARGILDEGGEKCFRDTIDFVRGCHGAVGGETEDVLMLGEHVVNQSVPLILCDEEDVDGSHGASIGRLDQQTLYYMASRGISEEQARIVIAEARMRAVIDLIPSAEARAQASETLSKLLEGASEGNA